MDPEKCWKTTLQDLAASSADIVAAMPIAELAVIREVVQLCERGLLCSSAPAPSLAGVFGEHHFTNICRSIAAQAQLSTACGSSLAELVFLPLSPAFRALYRLIMVTSEQDAGTTLLSVQRVFFLEAESRLRQKHSGAADGVEDSLTEGGSLPPTQSLLLLGFAWGFAVYLGAHHTQHLPLSAVALCALVQLLQQLSGLGGLQWEATIRLLSEATEKLPARRVLFPGLVSLVEAAVQLCVGPGVMMLQAATSASSTLHDQSLLDGVINFSRLVADVVASSLLTTSSTVELVLATRGSAVVASSQVFRRGVGRLHAVRRTESAADSGAAILCRLAASVALSLASLSWRTSIIAYCCCGVLNFESESSWRELLSPFGKGPQGTLLKETPFSASMPTTDGFRGRKALSKHVRTFSLAAVVALCGEEWNGILATGAEIWSRGAHAELALREILVITLIDSVVRSDQHITAKLEHYCKKARANCRRESPGGLLAKQYPSSPFAADVNGTLWAALAEIAMESTHNDAARLASWGSALEALFENCDVWCCCQTSDGPSTSSVQLFHPEHFWAAVVSKSHTDAPAWVAIALRFRGAQWVAKHASLDQIMIVLSQVLLRHQVQAVSEVLNCLLHHCRSADPNFPSFHEALRLLAAREEVQREFFFDQLLAAIIGFIPSSQSQKQRRKAGGGDPAGDGDGRIMLQWIVGATFWSNRWKRLDQLQLEIPPESPLHHVTDFYLVRGLTLRPQSVAALHAALEEANVVAPRSGKGQRKPQRGEGVDNHLAAALSVALLLQHYRSVDSYGEDPRSDGFYSAVMMQLCTQLAAPGLLLPFVTEVVVCTFDVVLATAAAAEQKVDRPCSLLASVRLVDKITSGGDSPRIHALCKQVADVFGGAGLSEHDIRVVSGAACVKQLVADLVNGNDLATTHSTFTTLTQLLHGALQWRKNSAISALEEFACINRSHLSVEHRRLFVAAMEERDEVERRAQAVAAAALAARAVEQQRQEERQLELRRQREEARQWKHAEATLKEAEEHARRGIMSNEHACRRQLETARNAEHRREEQERSNAVSKEVEGKRRQQIEREHAIGNLSSSLHRVGLANSQVIGLLHRVDGRRQVPSVREMLELHVSGEISEPVFAPTHERGALLPPAPPTKMQPDGEAAPAILDDDVMFWEVSSTPSATSTDFKENTNSSSPLHSPAARKWWLSRSLHERLAILLDVFDYQGSRNDSVPISAIGEMIPVDELRLRGLQPNIHLLLRKLQAKGLVEIEKSANGVVASAVALTTLGRAYHGPYAQHDESFAAKKKLAMTELRRRLDAIAVAKRQLREARAAERKQRREKEQKRALLATSKHPSLLRGSHAKVAASAVLSDDGDSSADDDELDVDMLERRLINEINLTALLDAARVAKSDRAVASQNVLSLPEPKASAAAEEEETTSREELWTTMGLDKILSDAKKNAATRAAEQHERRKKRRRSKRLQRGDHYESEEDIAQDSVLSEAELAARVERRRKLRQDRRQAAEAAAASKDISTRIAESRKRDEQVQKLMKEKREQGSWYSRLTRRNLQFYTMMVFFSSIAILFIVDILFASSNRR